MHGDGRLQFVWVGQGVVAWDVEVTNQDGEVAGFERLGPAELIERLHADAFTLEAAMILIRWLESRHGLRE